MQIYHIYWSWVKYLNIFGFFVVAIFKYREFILSIWIYSDIFSITLQTYEYIQLFVLSLVVIWMYLYICLTDFAIYKHIWIFISIFALCCLLYAVYTKCLQKVLSTFPSPWLLHLATPCLALQLNYKSCCLCLIDVVSISMFLMLLNMCCL